jgi:hypothetical protein
MGKFACADCKVNTAKIEEYYMVHDNLWRAAGMNEGMLCIGCLEKCINRKLTMVDFVLCPLNLMNLVNGSKRLRKRMDANYALNEMLKAFLIKFKSQSA